MEKNIRRDDWETLEPSVFGWGINDVNYKVVVTTNIEGRQVRLWACPYYIDWISMLERGLSDRFKQKYPTYKDCTVTEGWRYLSNFVEWVDSQPNKNWEACSLDKDILISGNKRYDQLTTAYVPPELNSFVLDRQRFRGDCLLGVSSSISKSSPYCARCKNPFTGKCEYLGVFANQMEAHLTWKAKKHEYACALADLQEDPRVAEALRQRYAPDKDWTNK